MPKGRKKRRSKKNNTTTSTVADNGNLPIETPRKRKKRKNKRRRRCRTTTRLSTGGPEAEIHYGHWEPEPGRETEVEQPTHEDAPGNRVNILFCDQ